MPEEFAVDLDQRPPYRRRWLLRRGAEADLGWWVYESENPPGSSVGGVVYPQTSYTVKMPDGLRVTLLDTEVEGFVTREAVGRGRVDAIRYRPGLPK